MKVERLQIRNFTVFGEADFEFASGINVFIGENGTGKSHVLKLIYALLKGVREGKPGQVEAADRYLGDRLSKVFSSDLSSLVRLGGDDDGALLWLISTEGQTHCSISDELTLGDHTWQTVPDVVMQPARELLTSYRTFLSFSNSDYEMPFDESFADTCSLLQRDLKLKSGPARLAADRLAAPLRAALGGEVTLENDKFYVNFGAGKHEAHLVAEGLRKIATLVYLIDNGSIREGGMLLWDEPEANMNPKLITKVAEALHLLAANGVQIFVATHDLLLSQELSLIAEYAKKPAIDMRFFALHHATPIDPVEVERSPSLADLKHNAIVEAHAAHYDREQAAFGAAVRGGEGAA